MPEYHITLTACIDAPSNHKTALARQLWHLLNTTKSKGVSGLQQRSVPYCCLYGISWLRCSSAWRPRLISLPAAPHKHSSTLSRLEGSKVVVWACHCLTHYICTTDVVSVVWSWVCQLSHVATTFNSSHHKCLLGPEITWICTAVQLQAPLHSPIQPFPFPSHSRAKAEPSTVRWQDWGQNFFVSFQLIAIKFLPFPSCCLFSSSLSPCSIFSFIAFFFPGINIIYKENPVVLTLESQDLFKTAFPWGHELPATVLEIGGSALSALFYHYYC